MTRTTAREGQAPVTIATDPTVDRLIPLVQRSAARAALLHDSRLEIHVAVDGRIEARVVAGLR